MIYKMEDVENGKLLIQMQLGRWKCKQLNSELRRITCEAKEKLNGQGRSDSLYAKANEQQNTTNQ